MLTLIVGAQFGGEGKGKIGAYLGLKQKYDVVCRCGGVNSSHTVEYQGRTWRLRLLPGACITSKPRLVAFGAGTLLHVPTLLKEISSTKTNPASIAIDPRAGIVEQHHIVEQRKDKRYNKIGSTLTGTGYASADRALRRLRLARDIPLLSNMIRDVPRLLYQQLRKNDHVLIEGHQGFGLSNYHGDYPYTSSRDTTSAAYLSELGISPNRRMKIILAVKIFPTRNHPGYLPREMSKSEADVRKIIEFGGGSWEIPNRRRRVGKMDFNALKYSAEVNGATEIALMGADYFDASIREKRSRRYISPPLKQLIARLQKTTGLPVKLISTGPDTEAMIRL